MGNGGLQDALPPPPPPPDHVAAAVSDDDSLCRGNWGSLGDDVLGLIFDKLVVYDYMRCAAVCKPWYSYVMRMKKKQQQQNQHQLPLLLINPKLPLAKRKKNPKFYNIITNTSSSSGATRTAAVKKGYYCCGSSHGWLIFSHEPSQEDNDGVFALMLLNPFTGATIHLPPLLIQRDRNTDGLEMVRISKVVLSDDPSSNPDNYQVLALQYHQRLALFSSKHDKWIYAYNYFHDNLKWDSLSDIVYLNQKQKFYALIRGNIGSVKIEDSCYIRLETLVKEKVDRKFLVKPYLAESITGTLLYIERFPIKLFDHDEEEGPRMLLRLIRECMEDLDRILNNGPKTTRDSSRQKWGWRFRVYELVVEEDDDDGGRRKINKLIELGVDEFRDQALFLGYNHSVSVRASDFPGCKPSSIYYTLDNDHTFREAYDVGVYTLGDDEHVINPLFTTAQSRIWPKPIWIQPYLT